MIDATLGSMLHQHILIAGPSASGKSTLARALAAATGMRVFSLDAYWGGGTARYARCEHGVRVRHYEDPALYDGDRLAADLVRHGAPAIAEGFCLFQYPAILALPARRFYIDLSFDECLKRRMARRPQRPSDSSFLLIGEQETARWVEPQARIPGVVLLDGELSSDRLAARLALGHS